MMNFLFIKVIYETDIFKDFIQLLLSFSTNAPGMYTKLLLFPNFKNP